MNTIAMWTELHDDSPEVELACRLSAENHAYFHPTTENY